MLMASCLSSLQLAWLLVLTALTLSNVAQSSMMSMQLCPYPGRCVSSAECYEEMQVGKGDVKSADSCWAGQTCCNQTMDDLYRQNPCALPPWSRWHNGSSADNNSTISRLANSLTARSLMGTRYRQQPDTAQSGIMENFPWQCAVLEKGSDCNSLIYLGSGSLIHPRLVLTTGRIAHVSNGSKLYVHFGHERMEQASRGHQHRDMPVLHVLLHSNFDYNTVENNEALLVLEHDIPVSRFAAPVCPPSVPLRPELTAADLLRIFSKSIDMQRCFTAGWGLRAHINHEFDATLTPLPLKVHAGQCLNHSLPGQTSPELCNRWMVEVDANTDNRACDEGAPVVCLTADHKRLVQVGLTTRLGGCERGEFVNLLSSQHWYSSVASML